MAEPKVMQEGGDWANAAQPGTTPKINSIFDFSAEALGQLKLWLEQQGLNIPVSNILGFSQFTAKYANEDSEGHTTSTTYADPNVSGAAGPSLTGVSPGKYLLMFGGSGTTSSSGSVAMMSVQLNGAGATDTESVEINTVGTHASVSRAIIKTVTAANSTIKLVMRSTGGNDIDFRYRWVLALRYANP